MRVFPCREHGAQTHNAGSRLSPERPHPSTPGFGASVSPNPSPDAAMQAICSGVTTSAVHVPTSLAVMMSNWPPCISPDARGASAYRSANPAAEFIRGHGRLLLDPGLAFDGAVCGKPSEALVPDALLGHGQDSGVGVWFAGERRRVPSGRRQRCNAPGKVAILPGRGFESRPVALPSPHP